MHARHRALELHDSVSGCCRRRLTHDQTRWPSAVEAVGGSSYFRRMAVLDWLLDSDPALRWQVLRDLTDAPPEEVAAERAAVVTEGWGARLLALRGDDGQWAGGACFPADFRGDFSQGQPWTSTLPTLTLLRDFGIDPNAQPVDETVELTRENSRWEHAGQPFFAGEVEPCINGRTVAIGAYFGVDVDSIVARLLGEQLTDGGWNCETAERIGARIVPRRRSACSRDCSSTSDRPAARRVPWWRAAEGRSTCSTAGCSGG